MSNFPVDYDDDTTLPIVNDNIVEIGADAINALREAVFNIEQEVGLGGSGSVGTIATRLGISILPDGTINPSAITGLGLVTLPITNSQISNIAQIQESKLSLDHSTQDLFNYIADLSAEVNASNGWISSTGIKLEPHLVGVIYRHIMTHVDVSTDPAQYLLNKFENLRNNTNSYTLISDINNELLEHQFADGSPFGFIQNVITNNGSSYPSNYAHTASGLFLNTDRFSTIPQTAQDLQSFAQFIDDSSIFLYGTRIQNLYTNGVSRVSRSSSLSTDGYGSPIVPVTPAIAYLLNTGSNSSPFDDINYGDDIIELKPSAGDIANNSFDEKFALVRIGDIIRINYGTIEVGFVIKEKKYIQNGGNKKFVIRIAGKNLSYSAEAFARIDRPLVNNNKFGVLAIAAANNESTALQPSLIVGSPGGAMTLGNGFNADQLDSTHFLLHLALYPTGHPEDGYFVLPGIDVTGNAGATPGQYTLESVVESTNNALRKAGFNYRFIAYVHQGNFGIMLADSYNNTGFSISSGVVDDDGNYDETQTNIDFPNNVVDVFEGADGALIDPLGFGISGSNSASPLYQSTYASAEAAIIATKLFLPLRRNNYYVNGAERDKLNLDIGQVLDGYGDGYWTGTITNQNIYPGPSPVGRVETTYRIMLDLSASSLKAGKTIVAQRYGDGAIVDFGRFIIQSVNFGCYPNVYTDITVYDAVHGAGFSPTDTLAVGSEVALYFNYDSVSFNIESATDFTNVTPFKRYFEVYADLDGRTFTHERARMNASDSNLTINGAVTLYGASEVNKLEIIKVSPKLRGYQFGSVNKITLVMDEYDSATGIYLGYLTHYDGVSATKRGPYTYGKLGEVTRFYDESSVDYVDLLFGLNTNVINFTSQLIDIQLFPTLALDEEIMLLATCQLADETNIVSNIRDQRQFGNTSEKDLSTSALDYIAAPERLLHANGVIRGFDILIPDDTTGHIQIKGGVALVNGKILDFNPQTINIPLVKELSGILYDINWAVCVNSKGELQSVPLLDYDSTLPTPTSESRLFRAYDVISGSNYTLDAVTFSDLIIQRKDLVVLYIVTSLVTSPTVTITISSMDARKFIYNESEFIPLTFVPEDIDVAGHFKSINSVITWVNKFGSFNETIKVRGIFNFTDAVDLTSINKKVKFLGDGAVFNVTAAQCFLVKSNVTFDNITFNYNPTSFTSSGNISSEYGCIFGDTALTDGAVSDIGVNNCIFNSETANHPPYLSFRVGSDEYVKNIDITKNTFNDIFDHASAVAFVGTYTGWTAGQAAAIGNINVTDNYCLQDQTFYFVNSFSPSGDSFSIPGLTAVNVKIFNNKIGYIGYNISGNNKYSDQVIGDQLFSVERNQLIAVVGPLDDTGKNPETNPLGSGATGDAIPSGNVVILDNDVSFIITENRAGQPEVDGYVGYLLIKDNRLYANNFTTTVATHFEFLTSNLGGSVNGVGIYIATRNYTHNDDKISIIIDNNVLKGKEIDGTYYGYGAGIDVYGSAKITDNIIRLKNVQSAGDDVGFGIRVKSFTPFGDLTFSYITGNSIYRINPVGPAEAIAYYIRTIDAQAIITDNFFDSQYVDNSSTNEESIVVTSPPTSDKSLIMRNKNHVVTMIINAIEGHVDEERYDIGSLSEGDPISSLSKIAIKRYYDRDPNTVAFGPFDAGYVITASSTIDGPVISWTVPLKNYLPVGVIVLSVETRAGSTTNPTTGGNVNLTLERKKTTASAVETYTSVFPITNTYTPNDPIAMSVSVPAVTWKIDPTEIYNVLRFVFSSGLYSGSVYCDPIVLKYKW